MDELINKLYYEDLIYSEKQLYNKVKKRFNNVTHKYIKDFLKNQSAQQVNYIKPEKKIYKPIYAESRYSFQIDITFLPQLARTNNGYDQIFTAINVQTRYAYAFKSKSKEKGNILFLMRQFYMATPIEIVTCDNGREFQNKDFVEFCDEENIKVFYTSDSHKLGIINRFHRTLKGIFMKYFKARRSTKWVDILDKAVKSYNDNQNRMMDASPEEMEKNPFLRTLFINEQKARSKNVKDDEIDLNDLVRVKSSTKSFDKLHQNYSDEIYIVGKVNKNTLELIDENDESFTVKKSNVLKIPNKIIEQVDKSLDNEKRKHQINLKTRRLLK